MTKSKSKTPAIEIKKFTVGMPVEDWKVLTKEIKIIQIGDDVTLQCNGLNDFEVLGLLRYAEKQLFVRMHWAEDKKKARTYVYQSVKETKNSALKKKKK